MEVSERCGANGNKQVHVQQDLSLALAKSCESEQNPKHAETVL